MSRRGQNIRRRVSPRGIERFEARWIDSNGKDRQRTFRTRAAAEEFQALRRADIIRGQAADEAKGSRPFRHYATELVASKRAGHTRVRTADECAALLERYALPYFGDRPVGAITSADLRGYLAHLSSSRTRRGFGLAPNTIRNAWLPVVQTLALAALDGAIYTNPAAHTDIKLPRLNAAPAPVEFRYRLLPATDAAAVIAALDRRDPTGVDSLVLAFLLSTGVRAGELAGLEVGDVVLPEVGTPTARVLRTKTRRGGRDVVAPPKTANSTRGLPLAPWLAARLRSYLANTHPMPSDPTAPLFPRRVLTHPRPSAPDPRHNPALAYDWSRPIEMGGYLGRFRAACLAAGADPRTRIHDLRHTFCTDRLAAGIPLIEVSRMAGHANTLVTDSIYAHVRAEDLGHAVQTVPDPFVPAPRSALPMASTR